MNFITISISMGCKIRKNIKDSVFKMHGINRPAIFAQQFFKLAHVKFTQIQESTGFSVRF